jgi:hypothetical protein
MPHKIMLRKIIPRKIAASDDSRGGWLPVIGKSASGSLEVK